MTQEETDRISLTYELLKRLDTKFDRLNFRVKTLENRLISVRQDVHGMRSDALRYESTLIRLAIDMERIQTRLELHGGN